MPVEGHVVKVFNLVEVGESEYHWQSPNGAMTSFEAMLVAPKKKSIKKMNIYTSKGS